VDPANIATTAGEHNIGGSAGLADIARRATMSSSGATPSSLTGGVSGGGSTLNLGYTMLAAKSRKALTSVVAASRRRETSADGTTRAKPRSKSA
jgi:hypothetical protein